jgi:hypothetical protein
MSRTQQVINQLQIIKKRSVSINNDEIHVWGKDAAAIDYAIKVIKKYKNCRDAFWEGFIIASVLSLFWIAIVLVVY